MATDSTTKPVNVKLPPISVKAENGHGEDAPGPTFTIDPAAKIGNGGNPGGTPSGDGNPGGTPSGDGNPGGTPNGDGNPDDDKPSGGGDYSAPKKKKYTITSGDASIDDFLNPNGQKQTQHLMGGLADADIDPIDRVDIEEEKGILSQLKTAQEEQAINTITHGVDNSVADLQRNLEDAQNQFQVSKNTIDRDERNAMDNQALYASARGDRGGIAQSQYNSIQNNAATNRLAVQREQTKLATDTARQIADLRNEGEFKKADQLLSISQTYLSNLLNLQQWMKQTNVGIDEFNKQLEQWSKEYTQALASLELNIANSTGSFADGTPTAAAWLQAQQQLAAAGNAMLAAGMAPTAEQLEAMGLTEAQAIAYLKKKFPNG